MIQHWLDRQEGVNWRRAVRWASRVSLGNKLAFGLAGAALLSGIATYLAMTESATLHLKQTQAAFWLLNLDLVILLLLGVIVARRIVALWVGRKRGLAGARLHSRMVLVFGALATIPAILTAIFAAIFFYVGVQSWFSDHVRTAVDDSLAVAQSYLHEHQQAIRADALAMASDLNREAPWVMGSPTALNHLVRTQALTRNLTEAVLIDGSGHIIAKSGFALTLEYDPVDPTAIERARDGEVLILSDSNDNRVRALVRLDRFVDTFLYVGRRIEPDVLNQINAAQNAVVEYKELEGRSSELQIKITAIFLIIALLMLMAAVWLGIMFAKQLVTPIAALIGAAELVRAGDLSARVVEGGTEDELATLGRAFNRMAAQLEGQRRDLVEVNRQLDLRRRFTETVLAGVSAGVIGLDAAGRIIVANVSAANFLNLSQEELVGKYIVELIPDVAPLLNSMPRGGRPMQIHVDLKRPGVPERSFLLRVGSEEQGGGISGYVVTFDDLTDLMAAQRKAAWADVARRIAHEIKNPLTPIQLSAERLKRKYSKEITNDLETFQMCTDTIIRHVGDIGRMVDEFSAFARMPAPVMRVENMSELCNQLATLRSDAYQGIEFSYEAPLESIYVECDSRQMRQAITNLLQNAVEAVEGRVAAEDGSALPIGRVRLLLSTSENEVRINVEDNGRGLPVTERDRLTEPYVTTRTKGTGLGLAIVKKIMEDHQGGLILEDVADGGALVTLTLPLRHTVAT
jgi:two-component system nitrogen regulation sensor histidine kinase NtrY